MREKQKDRRREGEKGKKEEVSIQMTEWKCTLKKVCPQERIKYKRKSFMRKKVYAEKVYLRKFVKEVQ